MSKYLQDASLRHAGLLDDTSIYQLHSKQLSNRYFVLSNDGTRRLMAFPEVVGYDSYLSMLPATVAALRHLFPKGQGGDVDILTILRGGLNYPIEEACYRCGIRVRDIHFLSCERIIEDHIITGLEIKYEKLTTTRGRTLVIGDILEVRPTGTVIWAAVWDRITFWKGAESCLYAVIDEPEFVHAMMKRFLEIEMDAVDQLEAQNLLAAGPGVRCHCVETYVDEDRFRAIDQSHIRAADCWIAGAAQIFSEISPAMHDEFEIEYMKPLYDRFGWVHYGCCEPLFQKIDIIRKMKTVRSISASPWTKVDRQAEAMGGDYVMLRKPNPAYLRSGYPDVDAVNKEIRGTLAACRRSGTPVAFVLKDLTTVGSRAEGLGEWVKLVQAEIENA